MFLSHQASCILDGLPRKRLYTFIMFSFSTFKIAAVVTFLISGTVAFAAPLSSEEVFQKLRPLAKDAKHPTVFKSKSQISVTLPSDKDRGDEQKEWVFSSVTAEVSGQNKVPQIYVETENCNVKRAELDIDKMQKRVQHQVRIVSSAVFGTISSYKRSRRNLSNDGLRTTFTPSIRRFIADTKVQACAAVIS